MTDGPESDAVLLSVHVIKLSINHVIMATVNARGRSGRSGCRSVEMPWASDESLDGILIEHLIVYETELGHGCMMREIVLTRCRPAMAGAP